MGIEKFLTTRLGKGEPLTYEEMDRNIDVLKAIYNLLISINMPLFITDAFESVFTPINVYDTAGEYTLNAQEVGVYSVKFTEGAINSNVTVNAACNILDQNYYPIDYFTPDDSNTSYTFTVEEPVIVLVGTDVFKPNTGVVLA